MKSWAFHTSHTSCFLRFFVYRLAVYSLAVYSLAVYSLAKIDQRSRYAIEDNNKFFIGHQSFKSLHMPLDQRSRYANGIRTVAETTNNHPLH
ncbi:MAG: hypothetical protein F6K56_31230 [Moorea sp. SIO3G5]|nr:hypothetical protein [Moorena sp. SIO3G5]